MNQAIEMTTCQTVTIHIRMRHHGAAKYRTVPFAHYGNVHDTDDRARALARRMGAYSYYLSN